MSRNRRIIPKGARCLLAALTLVATVVTVGAPPASAASRNEILTTFLYDGTPEFDPGEPTGATGAVPEP